MYERERERMRGGLIMRQRHDNVTTNSQTDNNTVILKSVFFKTDLGGQIGTKYDFIVQGSWIQSNLIEYLFYCFFKVFFNTCISVYQFEIDVFNKYLVLIVYMFILWHMQNIPE